MSTDLLKTKEQKQIEANILKENALQFSTDVENLVWEKDISYLDAILELVEKRSIELEVIPKLITKELFFKLEEEAIDLKLVTSKRKLTSLSKFLKIV